MYCAAAENGFEDIAGKSINEMDLRTNKDIMSLAMACIIAAYSEASEVPPVDSKDLLYKATSKELTDLYLTVINLRSKWYNVPTTIADKLQQEADQMTDEEKAEVEKNV